MGVAPGSGGLDGWVDWARLVLELLVNDELLMLERAAAGGRTTDRRRENGSGGAEVDRYIIIINHQLLLLRIRFKMRKRSSLALLCY